MRNYSKSHQESPDIQSPSVRRKEPMSTKPPPPSHQLNFAPIHRTVQLENIHEQVTQSDLQQQQQIPSTRKVLTKYVTVIGDGSDIDTCEIKIQ